MNPQLGKYIMMIGVAILVVGIIVYFFHNKLHWLGRLPGDIRIERENFRFYFPITTMVFISLLLSLIIQFIRRL